MTHYIGKKGYTILKSSLTEDVLNRTKSELWLKPQMPGKQYTQNQVQAFPVFRENDKKLYIPRFYGEEKFGAPCRSELDDGLDINVEFTKELRDYQYKIVDVYMNHVSKGSGGGILEVPCGRGKCLGKNTPILMHDGTIKNVQDICVGEYIMGDDSTPRKILTLARGREQMYKVIPKKGDSYIVNESHILSLKYSSSNSVLDIHLQDYLKLSETEKDDIVGYRVPVLFPEKKISIEPYLLGFWLGNNTSTNIIDGFTNELKHYNLLENKHIPIDYKCNIQCIQLNLLAGIIDGNNERDNCIVIYKNNHFVDDILYLCRTIGLAAYKEVSNDMYLIFIYNNDDIDVPCKLESSIAKVQKIKDALHTRIRIEKLEVDDYYGFEIDGNRRFVLGDFTVTHNTVMALKILSNIKKKTMILVHKEFLMNQWIERIQEFIPQAKVGKIQAQICDVEDKDIVIGMIQTMYTKTYDQSVYSQFGLTIIDEVHRIGSEEFSKTLLKTVTPYMLGISATVERKDKLTSLLYMFIGPRIYSETRTNDDTVCVRAFEYVTRDDDFNTVETDFRGQVKYSSMMSKLCSYGPRSDFIVKVIHDLIIENPDGQIMILAHYKNVLKYLHEKITFMGFASVGYYIGGMKQKDLEISETKQIVIATYAMAAEALDIKSLSRLVMATPKSDIIQSVGRILRMKHENPIVVDIIDNHECFQNQWFNRKRFYKKSNYLIKKSSNDKYTSFDDDSWKIEFTPK